MKLDFKGNDAFNLVDLAAASALAKLSAALPVALRFIFRQRAENLRKGLTAGLPGAYIRHRDDNKMDWLDKQTGYLKNVLF